MSTVSAEIRDLLKGNARTEARQRAAAALRSAPFDAREYSDLAEAFADFAQYDEAVAFAQEAVKLAPRVGLFWCQLGRIYQVLHRLVPAAQALEEASRLEPQSIEVNFRLANFLLDAGQGTRAREHYERAIAYSRKPSGEVSVSAVLLERYASCLTALGDTARATMVYTHLKQNAATRANALFEITVSGEPLAQADLDAEIRSDLARSDLTDGDRSKLLLALGRIEEKKGNFDAAFDCWMASRALLKSGYDREHDERYTRGVVAVYSREVLGAAVGLGSSSEVPIFVVGLARSGTTLTEKILAAHPDGAGVGELRDFATRHSRFMSAFAEGDHLARFGEMMKAGEFSAAGEDHLSMLQFLAGRKARIVQKYPLNYIALGYIHMVFPRARIVHCRRHPADCFLSAFQNDMNAMHGYCYDQVDFAYRYRNYETLMRHWSSQFGDKIFDLQYEDLVDRPEATVRRLLDFVGLPWNDQVLSFHAKASTVNTPSRGQVRQPLYRSSIGRWQRYERQLTPLLSMLAAART
jgi:tetratricopeptide (TPR) repeat protein